MIFCASLSLGHLKLNTFSIEHLIFPQSCSFFAACSSLVQGNSILQGVQAKILGGILDCCFSLMLPSNQSENQSCFIDIQNIVKLQPISLNLHHYHHYLNCCYLLSAAAAAKSLQSCLTVQPHRRQHTRHRRPWDSPGKNTGVGCHFLLQRMKVKSESEVAQSRPTLSNPMDCSPPGSSIHGIFQARVLEWGAIAFSQCILGFDKCVMTSFHHYGIRQNSFTSLQIGCVLPSHPHPSSPPHTAPDNQ